MDTENYEAITSRYRRLVLSPQEGTIKDHLRYILAIWPFHWLADMKGALPPNLISSKQYPKVYAWIDRFKAAISKAKTSAPKPTTLKGPEAVKFVAYSEYTDKNEEVESDPLGLHKGQEVEAWPVDTGFKHHDKGKLVALNSSEISILSRTKDGEGEVRIHHPRRNFRIRAVSGSQASKL